MWIARISRPGAIYDASAAAQKFPDGKTIESKGGNGNFPQIGEQEDYQKEGNNDFEHIPGFRTFLKAHQSSVSKVNLLGKIRRQTPSKNAFYSGRFDFSENATRELKGVSNKIPDRRSGWK